MGILKYLNLQLRPNYIPVDVDDINSQNQNAIPEKIARRSCFCSILPWILSLILLIWVVSVETYYKRNTFESGFQTDLGE